MTEDGNRKISKIWYSVNTNNNKAGVEIVWDGATNATAMFLSGNGYFDLRTEQILLEVSTQREECCHAGGSVDHDQVVAVLQSVLESVAPPM